jgi:hypothetical protein
MHLPHNCAKIAPTGQRYVNWLVNVEVRDEPVRLNLSSYWEAGHLVRFAEGLSPGNHGVCDSRGIQSKIPSPLLPEA